MKKQMNKSVFEANDENTFNLFIIMLMVDTISVKVISVTSAREKGKSSAMDLTVAGAVCYGYSNIIVTAPRIGMFVVH